MSLPIDLPIEMHNAVTRELKSGEHVVWSGRPNAARATAKAFFIWFFAVPWLSISTVFFGAALSKVVEALLHGVAKNGSGTLTLGMAFVFLIFSTPFMAIGLGLMYSPFYLRGQMGKTLYVITNQRALSLTFGRSLKVTTLRPENIGKMEKKISPDGSGTLSIQTGTHKDSDGDKRIDTFEFAAVPDVSGAARAIDDLLSYTQETK